MSEKKRKNNQSRFIPTVKLKEINLGKVSGESESKNENFDNFFYTGNRKYEEICSSDKFIIRGRKGTGKTILAHYIKKKSPENNIFNCKINTLKDVHLQKLVHLDNRELLEEEYKVFWRYCVLLELGYAILENKSIKNLIDNKFDSKYSPINKEIRNLKKFVKERYDNRYKLVEVNKSYSTTKKKNANVTPGSTKSKNSIFKLISGSAGIAKENTAGVTEKYQVKEYYTEVDILEKLILKVLKNEKQGYVIIYDDLDELGDNLEENKNYRKLILGMIFAIQGLNDKIQSVNDNSKIIISIRDDILKSLNKHSSNLRKVIEDNSVNLYWINKNCTSPTDLLLINLILTKIKASSESYRNIPKNKLFKALFPTDISSVETADYLLDLSMGRPRQVIELLNMIIEDYPNEITFKPNHFRNCLKRFSPQLYSDLENEFSVYENKDELNDSMILVKNLKRSKFEYGEIAAEYNAHRNKYKHIDDIERSLNLMYSFGVIGTYENNGHGDRWSWGYREDSKDDIHTTDTFIVHKALRHKFNIS